MNLWPLEGVPVPEGICNPETMSSVILLSQNKGKFPEKFDLPLVIKNRFEFSGK